MTFKYDPFGRRIQKVSVAGGTVNYLYDGANIVAELSSSGAVLAKYTQGLGIDEPLAMNRGGSNSYYNADGLGTITSLIDSSGNAVASYTYDGYGNLTAAAGSVVNPFRYTGREWDTETGYYYYRARYYDANNGKFINEDPLGDIAGSNHYAYVLNRPTGFVDPLGLAPTWWHHDATLQLANAIFGPNCAVEAQLVAKANASVDDNHGVKEWLQFIFGTGTGWSRPGPHFPDSNLLSQLRHNAFDNGSLSGLGKYLHSLQDNITHDTIAPFDHWTHGPIPDYEAIRDLGTEDRALMQTAVELTAFRDKFLQHCKNHCRGGK